MFIYPPLPMMGIKPRDSYMLLGVCFDTELSPILAEAGLDLFKSGEWVFKDGILKEMRAGMNDKDLPTLDTRRT